MSYTLQPYVGLEPNPIRKEENENDSEEAYEGETDELFGPDLWGPPLWYAFHTAAECSDHPAAQHLWPVLLTALDSSGGIPCPECSGHFSAWYRAHPYDIQSTPSDVQSYMRTWILDLHNNVNRHAEPPTPEWTTESVRATYGDESSSSRTAKCMEALAKLTVVDGLVGEDVLKQLRTLLQTVCVDTVNRSVI